MKREKHSKGGGGGVGHVTYCSFDSSGSKYDFYIAADCMNNSYSDLKKHASEIINYEKKEMLPLRDEEIEFYNNKW